jgi:tetratricopeptide (TPR) repeat protein
VVQDNLALLLRLYRRPRAAMGDIMDGASLLFAAAAVLAVSAIATLPALSLLATLPASASERATPAERSPARGASDEEGAEDEEEAAAIHHPTLPGLAAHGALSGSVSDLFALALLYVPAALLLATLLNRIGSFGVAFRRDYGSLLACSLMAWAAAHLPVALAGVAAAAVWPGAKAMMIGAGLRVAGAVYFTGLAAVGVRTVLGITMGSAAAVALLAWLALLLEPYLVFAASPFVLFWGWQFLSRDIGDVTFSFGARQSFKRHLLAATLNPRDAEAHYQLGLIHQQRGQDDLAAERFRKAIEIDPTEVDAHYQLGRLARKQGRLPDAIAHFERVVARAPTHARHEVWREIGGTYLDSGEPGHARWALEKYTEQRPHDPEGLYQLACALRALNEHEAARQTLVRCIEAADTTPRYRSHEVRRWRKLAAADLAARVSPP